MIITFNTETITSRKWIMIMTILPAIIVDAAVLFFNRYAWVCWGIYSDVDMELNPDFLKKYYDFTPHVAILSLGLIILSTILLSLVIYFLLYRNNILKNRNVIKHFNIIILAKAFVFCCIMYLWFFTHHTDAIKDWGGNLEWMGIMAALFLPLTYIPTIVLICKNKDKV